MDLCRIPIDTHSSTTVLPDRNDLSRRQDDTRHMNFKVAEPGAFFEWALINSLGRRHILSLPKRRRLVRARALSIDGLIRDAKLLQDLLAAKPLVLRNVVPTQDTKDCDGSEDHACLCGTVRRMN